MMQKLLIALVLLAGCSQNENSSKQDIQNTIKNFQDAYNQQDAEKLSALWASDAIYSNPVTGETAEGREAIKKIYQDRFAKGKIVRLEIVDKSIEFPAADEAIEKGIMKVSVQDKPVKQVAYKAEFIKEKGQWQIFSIGEIELQEATSNYEHLKDLEWMVGNWKDTDDNIEILFSTQWLTNKNFLIEDFQMKIYGHDDIEGKQIIGWDPVKKTIRSWIFDSDGGFGEGTWEKADKSWNVDLKFTLSDGRLASSKNIYTPLNDHSYTFASVEREVDGEILPDMDPVKVEKQVAR